MFCPFCGVNLNEKNFSFCPSCGKQIISNALKDIKQVNNYDGRTQYEYEDVDSDVHPYYRKIFKKFDDNQGKYLLTWNWYAFIFGIFWYFSKKMWLKPLVVLLVVVTLSIFPPLNLILPVITIPIWLYYGAFANYDYYMYKRKRIQWYNPFKETKIE